MAEMSGRVGKMKSGPKRRKEEKLVNQPGLVCQRQPLTPLTTGTCLCPTLLHDFLSKRRYLWPGGGVRLLWCGSKRVRTANAGTARFLPPDASCAQRFQPPAMPEGPSHRGFRTRWWTLRKYQCNTRAAHPIPVIVFN